MSREILGEPICRFIDECQLDPQPESRLIAVLHRVQAQLLRVPASTVSGVASFYHFFCLQPRGKFIISVCLGTAFYVKGADRITQRLIRELGITWGETSKDGLLSLEAARCVGTFGLTPVVAVDGQVPVIFGRYLKKAREVPAARQG
jgi:hypothetical protein